MKIDYSILVQEVATEIRAGSTADAAIVGVAADNDASATVLRARFERAYPEGVPAEVDMGAKVAAEVAAQCQRFGVPESATVGPIWAKNGRKVIAICRLNGSTVLAVCIETATVWRMGAGLFSDAAVSYAMAA